MIQRLRWVDNLKGFLALLVVLGHTVTWSGLAAHMDVFQFIYFYISSFHMSAFFAVSGYLYGRIAENSLQENKTCLKWTKVVKRTIDLAVPSVVCMGVTFCVVRTLGKFSLAQAISVSKFWFVWVIIAIDIGHLFLYFIIKKEETVFLILSVLTVLFGFLFNTLGKMFGYFLLYELGVSLGRHLTKESEKKFFNYQYGRIALIITSIAIFFGYVLGGGAIVLNALYKIPIGIMMSYSLFSIFLAVPSVALFETSGKFTLQIYFFQVVTTAWIKTYTQNIPLWINCIVFIVITWIDYRLPCLLATKYKNTKYYNKLFCASKYIFLAKK